MVIQQHRSATGSQLITSISYWKSLSFVTDIRTATMHLLKQVGVQCKSMCEKKQLQENTVQCCSHANSNSDMCFIALGCNCDKVGSLSTDCNISSGQCNCRQMYTARQCNQCSKGFYSFPECKGSWLPLAMGF